MVSFLPDLEPLLADIRVPHRELLEAYRCCAPPSWERLSMHHNPAAMLLQAARSLAGVPHRRDVRVPPLFAFIQLVLCHVAAEKAGRLQEWLDGSLARFVQPTPASPASRLLNSPDHKPLPTPAGRGLNVPARVEIAYEVETNGLVEKVEFPFAIGVLADLSGMARHHLPPLRWRRFVTIDRDNFHEVFCAARPRLILRVPNRLAEDINILTVELEFRHLDDFRPEGVVAQVAPLKDLLAQRNHHIQLRFEEARRWGRPRSPEEQDHFSKWVAAVDEKLSAQLNDILHHPDFQRLEATWRGLDYLLGLRSRGRQGIRALWLV